MSSEIKVDTISENTSAGGVTIDSLGIKDGKVTNLMNSTLSAADLGAGLHVKVSDSGASVDGSYDTLVVEESGHSGIQILSGTSSTGLISFNDSGGVDRGYFGYAHSGDRMEFGTAAAERMRITSSGDVCIGRTDATIDSSNFGIVLRYYGEVRMARDAAGTSPCLDVYGTAGQFRVMGDGDVENTNNRISAISDERIKTNITDANSQWDDIKAIEVKNFERKDDVAKYGAGKKVQIGVIAQQVESVSPGLVKDRDPTKVEINMSSEFGTLYTADDAETKDGNDAVLYTSDDDEVKYGRAKAGNIKTEATHSKKIGDIKEAKDQVKSVGYSILYMKAIKALQEAMTRIETLEAEVTALKGE